MSTQTEEIKNISTANIGKDEMNLVEFPISLLSKRNDNNQKTIKFSDNFVGDNNKPIKREWVVTGSDEFGLPLVYDNDILIGLLQMGKERNFDSPTINFSRYRLLRVMNWQDNGQNYKRIEDALNRLAGVRIYAKNAFWDNEKKGYFTVNLGVLDSYGIFESSSGKSSGQESLPFSYVVLNSVLYKSIQTGYIKNLDIQLYFGLESAIAKRLYRYLDKKRYGKRKFEISIFTLAEAHLGLAKCKYASQIKEKLDPVHDDLIKAGFLKSAEYAPTADGLSEKVIYVFGKRAELTDGERKRLKIKEAKGKKAGEETPEEKVVKLLVDAGITELAARQMVRNYPLQKIETQIKALPFRKANNPAGMLVASINEDWALPNEYVKKVKKAKQDNVAKQKQEQEEAEKAERRKKIEGYISSLSPCDMEKLTDEARELAKKEGGTFFNEKPVPEFLLKSYIHIMVEKKLALK